MTAANPSRATCPYCLRRIRVRSHPSTAWRLMVDHDLDGERCPGSGRSVGEAQERKRIAEVSR